MDRPLLNKLRNDITLNHMSKHFFLLQKTVVLVINCFYWSFTNINCKHGPSRYQLIKKVRQVLLFVNSSFLSHGYADCALSSPQGQHVGDQHFAWRTEGMHHVATQIVIAPLVMFSLQGQQQSDPWWCQKKWFKHESLLCRQHLNQKDSIHSPVIMFFSLLFELHLFGDGEWKLKKKSLSRH